MSTYHGEIERVRGKLSAALAAATERLDTAVAGLAAGPTYVPAKPLRDLIAAATEALQHAAELAGLLQAAPFVTDPTPGTDGPECLETDHDHRGDCDGDMVLVKLLANHGGAQSGELRHMCGSHCRQATRRREAEIVTVLTSAG